MSAITVVLLIAALVLVLALVVLGCLIRMRRNAASTDRPLVHPMTHPLDDSRYPHWWD